MGARADDLENLIDGGQGLAFEDGTDGLGL